MSNDWDCPYCLLKGHRSMRSVKCLRHNEYKNASILERKHLQKNGRKRQQKKHNVSAKDNGIINGRKRQQKNITCLQKTTE